MEGFAGFILGLGEGAIEFFSTPILVGVLVFSCLGTIVIMIISAVIESVAKNRE